MTKYPLRQQKQESGKFSLSIILEIQILETQMRPEIRIRTFKLNRFLSLFLAEVQDSFELPNLRDIEALPIAMRFVNVVVKVCAACFFI